ncbi:MAG TPA: protein kinase [Blastocatellia bacterium]|nr:protein kinase [Blastocatellia bacterium]
MKYCQTCRKSYPTTQRFCTEDGRTLSFEDPYHLVGSVLAERYRLDALAGIGGMGAVYSAHHLALDRRVALKILQPNIAVSNVRLLELFEREAKTAAQLTHENIVIVLDAGRTAGNFAYIAMEWLEGYTLAEEIAARGRLEFGRVMEILQQVAAALEAAHAARVVHRDLKPANIMLVRQPDGRERLKVLDFGIAKVINDSTVSPVSAVMGTPLYASPEQLSLGGRIDGRADIYSLGIILFEMLAGEPPFNAASAREMLHLQMSAPPPPLRKFRPDAPPGLETLINRMLAKNPENRPQSAGQIPALYENAGYSDLWVGNDQYPFPELEDGSVALHFHGEYADDLAGSSAPDSLQPAIDVAPEPFWKRAIVRRAALGSLIVFAAMFCWLLWPVVKSTLGFSLNIDSVAVLPFKNDSGDPNSEYLGAGITDELIHSLSRLPQLRVIARSSVFRYKDREVEPQTVGRDLNIQGVITGRVARRGNRLFINVELVDARNDQLLWSERYERDPADLPKLPVVIAREAAAKLRSQLTGEDEKRMTERGAGNAEAYQFYLKGRFALGERTPDGVRRGIEYFRQALQKDPKNALAYSGLADSYFVLGPVGIGALPARDTMTKQKEAAITALELDETLAEARTSLAVVKLVYDLDLAGAEQEYKSALQINPNYAIAHNWYAIYLTSRGLSDQAIAESRRALELDPLSASFSANLADHYFYARQFDQAAAQYRKTIAMAPKLAAPHAGLARIYELQRKYDESLVEVNQAITLSKRSPKLIALLGHINASAGRKDEALRLLRELERAPREVEVSQADFALVYLALDDKERALTSLRKAVAGADPALLYLKVDPAYDGVRSDRRFKELLKRIE